METGHLSTRVVETGLYSIIVSRILYALPPWGGFLNAEFINRINAFFKRLQQFGYTNCIVTIDDRINGSEYEFFKNVWCHGISFIICCLPPYHTSDLHNRGHLFQLPEYATDIHMNLLSFGHYLNMSNKIASHVMFFLF